MSERIEDRRRNSQGTMSCPFRASRMMPAGLVPQTDGVGPGSIDQVIMIVSGVVSGQVEGEGPKGWGLIPARFEGCIIGV